MKKFSTGSADKEIIEYVVITEIWAINDEYFAISEG